MNIFNKYFKNQSFCCLLKSFKLDGIEGLHHFIIYIYLTISEFEIIERVQMNVTER
jgi:hypothetical protein